MNNQPIQYHSRTGLLPDGRHYKDALPAKQYTKTEMLILGVILSFGGQLVLLLVLALYGLLTPHA